MLRVVPLLIGTTLLMASTAMAEGLSPSSRDNFDRQDDLVIAIETTQGNCPTQIRFWREYESYFEPGEHSGMMLDVSSIGQGDTEFIDSQDNSVTFRTPLTPEFYTCVGSLASSDEERQHRLFNIWFGQGHVYFHFDVSPIAPAYQEDWYFANITHQEIVGQYPYVRWAVGD